MIIVKLIGGLGNQLFEYAAARRLSLQHDTELKLDLSWFENQSLRRFGLNHFNIAAEIAIPRDLLRICPQRALSAIARKYLGRLPYRIMRKISAKVGVQFEPQGRYYEYNPEAVSQPPLMIGRVVSQRWFHFDPEVLSCPDDVYMVGTWISYKYWEDAADVLRNELIVKHPLSGKNLELANIILNNNSVSIHFRCTDKVNDPLYNPVSTDYVERAMEMMKVRVDNPLYFVFSDNIEWAKIYMGRRGDVFFVDYNGDLQDYDDFRLMTMCKHNIIAESSFSWWAAWLNPNPDKIVISPSPRLWVNLNNFYTGDILPPDWLLVHT